MIQFIRDLALLPAILRKAAANERYRRWAATPEGEAHERARLLETLEQLRREQFASRLLTSERKGTAA